MSIKKIKSLIFDIQLFADGGSATATAGDGQNVGTETSESGVSKFPTSKRAEKNPLANVVYGKQADDEQVATAQNDAVKDEVKPKSFDDLIKGEYKKDFDSKVQSIIKDRLKNSKETVEKYEALKPMLEVLANKYGVKPDDIEALGKAIDEDNSFYENEAEERGISVELLKSIKKMERENTVYKKMEQEQIARNEANKKYASWMEQAEKAKAVYPSLDLKTEVENPQFLALLKSGVDVEAAYTVVHRNEIIPAAMAVAAKQAETKVTNSVIANKSRPVENGINSSATAVVKRDVSTLTKEDRAEIARRVQRGEKIVF